MGWPNRGRDLRKKGRCWENLWPDEWYMRDLWVWRLAYAFIFLFFKWKMICVGIFTVVMGVEWWVMSHFSDLDSWMSTHFYLRKQTWFPIERAEKIWYFNYRWNALRLYLQLLEEYNKPYSFIFILNQSDTISVVLN